MKYVLSSCQTFCLESEMCQYFTYSHVADISQCSLFDSCPDLQYKVGAISGPIFVKLLICSLKILIKVKEVVLNVLNLVYVWEPSLVTFMLKQRMIAWYKIILYFCMLCNIRQKLILYFLRQDAIMYLQITVNGSLTMKQVEIVNNLLAVKLLSTPKLIS